MVRLALDDLNLHDMLVDRKLEIRKRRGVDQTESITRTSIDIKDGV
jgi:hypothetical protein